MDWETQIIHLREGSGGEPMEPEPVTAHVAGVLAIHRLPELGGEDVGTMRGWTVTHVATGRKLISDELATDCTRTRAERLVAWLYSNIAPNSEIWQVGIEDVEMGAEESPAFKRLVRALNALSHKLGWKPSDFDM